jgi:hypothetical protein
MESLGKGGLFKKKTGAWKIYQIIVGKLMG